MSNVIYIDRDYIELRKLWKNDRHLFSGELVRLTIKQKHGSLTEHENHRLETIERVIDENNSNWLDGYDLETLYMK